ncbi:ABC transporter ATP-binding protein [Micromonospora sp. DT229]|uniref:ABC transporter ATP-binding protein n=1 Tax=Micromonospora sp. DT229 TaxID=3393430 RepID=UPI003CF39ABC
MRTSIHGSAPAVPDDAAVVLDGLTKRYGDRTVVDRLTMHIPRGAVAGFVGPNGAGKTTAMAMLLGLVRPTGGTARVLGQPVTHPARYLRRVGALIEGPGFYPALTGVENLRVLAALGGHDEGRIPLVLDQVGLAGRGGDRFRAYSLGMKQRLGIAAALLGDPELVVLDEPSNGLDPAGMAEIRRLVAEIAAGGRTVLLSSHLLGELEQVCDWLLVLDRGVLRYQGSTRALTARAGCWLTVATEHPGDTERLLALLVAEGLRARRQGGEVVVEVPAEEADTGPAAGARINRLAYADGLVLAELHRTRASLEDQFLSMLGGAG